MEITMTGRAAIAAFFALALQPGCSASASTATPDSPESGGPARKDTRIIHEECDTASKSAEKVDVNGDGGADMTIVRAGSREACRAVDLNFDGTIDMWVYRDQGGQVRRRESDYDRDGRIDEISVYKGGQIVEKHRATTLGGKLDTWHYFKGGQLARTERDSDGDDVIDQWWEYPTANKPECPLIHSDIDGDGRPDPGATVDVCKEPGSGYVPPDRPQDKLPSGQTFERTSPDDVPVELENKEGGGGDQGEKKEGGE